MAIPLMPIESHPNASDPTMKLITWKGLPRPGKEDARGGVYSVKGGYMVTIQGKVVEGLFVRYIDANITLGTVLAKVMNGEIE